MNNTTIAAVATAPGIGGIAVIRVSGSLALPVLKQVFVPKGKRHLFEDRFLMVGTLMDGEQQVDECMAVYMKPPATYTREDVVELHVHGGEWVVDKALKMLFARGVMPAEPGEFTRRAFLNGRIDLSRAEAVMKIISARGEQAATAAMRQLKGGAFTFIHDKQQRLLDILASVEATIDFPDEVDESRRLPELKQKTEELAKELLDASDERSARLLDSGFEVTIFGPPNVGKSSLFNSLLMEEAAIVTDIPGTTRDVLRGSVLFDGLRINLNDTAGIHENTDYIEKIGVEKALGAMYGADLLLVVVDGSGPLRREDYALINQTEGKSRLLLQSKSDLNPRPMLEGALLFSAKTGEGLDEVRDAIVKAAGEPTDSALTLQRHILLAKRAANCLMDAVRAMDEEVPLDLVAIDLQAALSHLGAITGDQVDEKLLDEIFSTFCVGK